MRFAALVATLLSLASAAVSAAPVDWNAAAEHDVIEVISHDPDGARRESKVIVAALEGHGYVRTNDSRWFQNLVRDPNEAVRFGDVEYPVNAAVVLDLALRARVDAVFAERYPFFTWFSRLFGRNGGVNCLELTAREP